jgi:hypothetical protein
MIVWHVAAEWHNIELLLKLKEWAKENLTTQEIKRKLFLATNHRRMTT